MKLVNLSLKIFIGIILVTLVFSFNTENKSAVSASVSSSSSSESNLNHGIFLRKYKKVVSKSKTTNTNLNKNQNRAKTSVATNKFAKKVNNTPVNNTPSTPNQPTGGNNQKTIKIDGPILHKGWIKYYKIFGKSGLELKHPDFFKENSQFFEQPKYFPNADLNSKRDGIYQFIRDKNYFFLHLFENMISINSSLNVNKKFIKLNLNIIG